MTLAAILPSLQIASVFVSMAILIGSTLLIAWRVLRRKQQPAPDEEQVDYDGVIVAPTG